VLSSGRTLVGDLALSFVPRSSGEALGLAVTFPVALAHAPRIVALQGTAGCTTAHQAPAETLCLYSSRQTNVGSVIAGAAQAATDLDRAPVATADAEGFYFQVSGVIPGLPTLWIGSYAYTAP
jgi:hypothetical protein